MAVARIAELTESRRSIAQAYEVERRRIENDLHDGAQQYFVAAALKLGEAELEAMDTGNDELMSLIAETRARLEEGLTALRRTVHGIHPQVLRDRGLAAALEEVAEGYGPHVTVQCPHPLPTIDPNVLAAAYFFATESLTNAAKHAPDAPVSVLLTSDDRLHISVMDQGPGGAKVVRGHGISGMTERLAAFDGEVTIDSPVGGPTRIAAKIPLLLNRGESGIADGAGGRDDTDRATTGSATPPTPGESQ
ncbi:sensor histidine kinase [Corynebacterium sp. H78]|uniref:sensor histidine kinase n=1 Tax=Corynebacterium sp. H78 TaxID=3133417 RepID=UPI00309A4EBF